MEHGHQAGSLAGTHTPPRRPPPAAALWRPPEGHPAGCGPVTLSVPGGGVSVGLSAPKFLLTEDSQQVPQKPSDPSPSAGRPARSAEAWGAPINTGSTFCRFTQQSLANGTRFIIIRRGRRTAAHAVFGCTRGAGAEVGGAVSGVGRQAIARSWLTRGGRVPTPSGAAWPRPSHVRGLV